MYPESISQFHHHDYIGRVLFQTTAFPQNSDLYRVNNPPRDDDRKAGINGLVVLKDHAGFFSTGYDNWRSVQNHVLHCRFHH